MRREGGIERYTGRNDGVMSHEVMSHEGSAGWTFFTTGCTVCGEGSQDGAGESLTGTWCSLCGNVLLLSRSRVRGVERASSSSVCPTELYIYMASQAKHRPSSTVKRRRGPLPLRPKQYAKALYYDFINDFDKVTIKQAHERRIEKHDVLQKHLRKKGKTQGDSWTSRTRRNAEANVPSAQTVSASSKARYDPSVYAHEEMSKRMGHSLHRINTMHRQHKLGIARRPATATGAGPSRRDSPRKMHFKEVDLVKAGITQTALCAMCLVRFKKSNLVGKVTKKAIYDHRMLQKEIRVAKKRLRTAFMECPQGPHYIFREFGSAPMDESVRKMDESVERKSHRNRMSYDSFWNGCKVLFQMEFEPHVKEHVLRWLDRDGDGDINLQEFMLIMEESYNNDQKKRRKTNGDESIYKQARYVQRDLEHMDQTDRNMQKLPYRLYHTLYEFADVCRMCSHIFGGSAYKTGVEESRNPDEWHGHRPIPVSMRSPHQPRLLRRDVKAIFESWKARRPVVPFETKAEHQFTPVHVLSFDMVKTALARQKRRPMQMTNRSVSPVFVTPKMLKSSGKHTGSDGRDEVFESELEKRKLALLYKAWRKSGTDADTWMDSDAFKVAEEKAHMEAGLGELVDFADVEARSKFIIQGREDDVTMQGTVEHHVAPAMWSVVHN